MRSFAAGQTRTGQAHDAKSSAPAKPAAAQSNASATRWLGAPFVQAKLRIGEADDPLEREADRAADAVLAGSRVPPLSPVATRPQLKCADCEEEEGAVRMKQAAPAAATVPGEAPAIVQDVLRSPGQPLDAQTRAYFEPRFGADFSGVRIHTDWQAALSATRMNANAYTIGQDIVFGADRFAPTTVNGRRLVAHELAHVVQSAAIAPSMLRRDEKDSDEATTYDIPEIRDSRISDSSTQDELRRIYWEHGYESEGLTFRRVDKNHWVANQVVRRRKIIITDELSIGSPLGGSGASGEEGLAGETSAEKGGQGEAKTGAGSDTGSKAGGDAGGKRGGKPGGKLEGSTTGTRTEGDKSGEGSSALDDLAALAALISDPESLYEAQQSGNKGKGAQIGSKSGFLSGWFAQVLSIVLVFGGSIIKLFKKIGGLFKKGIERLVGRVERKALTEGAEALLSEAETAGLRELFGAGHSGAQDLLARARAGTKIAMPPGVTAASLQKYRELSRKAIERANSLVRDAQSRQAANMVRSVHEARIEALDLLLSRLTR